MGIVRKRQNGTPNDLAMFVSKLSGLLFKSHRQQVDDRIARPTPVGICDHQTTLPSGNLARLIRDPLSQFENWAPPVGFVLFDCLRESSEKAADIGRVEFPEPL